MARLNHDRPSAVLLAALLLLVLLVSWAGESAAAPQEGQTGAREFPPQAGFRRTEFTYSANGSPKTCAVRIWYPAAGRTRTITYGGGQEGLAAEDAPVAPGAHPVILFSHGLWSNPEFSAFLTEELARAGFIVAGVLHRDATTAEKGGWAKMAVPKFDKPAEWNETSYVDRRDDLAALLDHLLVLDQQEGSFLQGRVNCEAVGAMGHSMGGYTVLGAVGGWTSWRERRIKAALLMSPYILPYLNNGQLAGVDVPVMMQGATFDLGITPSLPALHQKLANPKYLLVLKNQSHLAWSNVICRGRSTVEAVEQEPNAKLITAYSIAFFEHHLSGTGRTNSLLTQANPALASYQFPARKK